MRYAADTPSGRRLLLLNKRNRPQTVTLPAAAAAATVAFVAPSTGDRPPQTAALTGRTIALEPFEVAVVRYEKK